MCTKRRESKKNCVVICMYTCIIKRDVHRRETCKIMTVVLQSFVARVSKDTDCYQLYPSNALASSSCCMSVSLVYLSRSSCTALGEGRHGKQIKGREIGTIVISPPLIVYMTGANHVHPLPPQGLTLFFLLTSMSSTSFWEGTDTCVTNDPSTSIFSPSSSLPESFWKRRRHHTDSSK